MADGCQLLEHVNKPLRIPLYEKKEKRALVDIPSRPLWFPLHFLKTQFTSLPYPDHDYTGQTVIVTGANVGLGLEAARHFARLGAAKVILACRSADKGAAARADIERSLNASSSSSSSSIEVWPLDMSSFASVAAFCKRVDAELARLDVLVENAGVATGVYDEADGGFESTIAVNVVSTFFMLLLLLPTLRKTASRFNKETKVVVVSSDAHLFVRLVLFIFYFFFFLATSSSREIGYATERRVHTKQRPHQAKFSERKQTRIFDAYKGKQNMNEDRYNTSKLLEIWIVRELAARMSPRDPVIVNCLNPGFCQTNLFRHMPFPLDYIVGGGLRLIGRTSEMGSRTLLGAAAADRQSHGKFLDSCVAREPGRLVVGQEGPELQRRVYSELMEILEDIQPGVTKNVSMDRNP